LIRAVTTTFPRYSPPPAPQENFKPGVRHLLAQGFPALTNL